MSNEMPTTVKRAAQFSFFRGVLGACAFPIISVVFNAFNIQKVITGTPAPSMWEAVNYGSWSLALRGFSECSLILADRCTLNLQERCPKAAQVGLHTISGAVGIVAGLYLRSLSFGNVAPIEAFPFYLNVSADPASYFASMRGILQIA